MSGVTLPQKTKEHAEKSGPGRVYEKSLGITRAIFYTKDEMEEDLRKAAEDNKFGRPLTEKDIKAFVEMAVKHDFDEEDVLVTFCVAYDKGVPPEALKEFNYRDVAKRYGFSVSDIIKLYEANKELNNMGEFGEHKLGIYRMIQSIQTANTQRGPVMTAAGNGRVRYEEADSGTKRFMRILIADEVFRKHDKDGKTLGKIMAPFRGD